MAQNLERFGKYVLLEKIASGGMAEVYLAKSQSSSNISKFFAVKRILPRFSNEPSFIEMFIEEAKIAINLDHQHVVTILEFGEEQGQFYLVMEFVEGKNLREFLGKISKANKRLSIDYIAYIISQVAAGLDYAHNCKDRSIDRTLNIIHRDISPQNVMISYEGAVKICDFGIAKAESKIESTQAGTLKGKYGYMSPEQVENLPLDRRTDIFSLGIVLWELLANERLFYASNELNTLRKIQECDVKPLRKIDPNIPAELERIANKALTKDRNYRYQTSLDLHRDLNRFLNQNYPDFSSKDLGVIMKQLYLEEMTELRRRMVEYAQIQQTKNGDVAESTVVEETRTVTDLNPVPGRTVTDEEHTGKTVTTSGFPSGTQTKKINVFQNILLGVGHDDERTVASGDENSAAAGGENTTATDDEKTVAADINNFRAATTPDVSQSHVSVSILTPESIHKNFGSNKNYNSTGPSISAPKQREIDITDLSTSDKSMIIQQAEEGPDFSKMPPGNDLNQKSNQSSNQQPLRGAGLNRGLPQIPKAKASVNTANSTQSNSTRTNSSKQNGSAAIVQTRTANNRTVSTEPISLRMDRLEDKYERNSEPTKFERPFIESAMSLLVYVFIFGGAMTSALFYFKTHPDQIAQVEPIRPIIERVFQLAGLPKPKPSADTVEHGTTELATKTPKIPVYISSNPTGADIYINDVRLDRQTPVMMDLDQATEFRLILYKPGAGYYAGNHSISLSGQQIDKPLNNIPVGRLTVETRLASDNAKLYLNGREFLNKAGIKNFPLPAGRYKIKVEDEFTGKKGEKTVSVEGDSSPRVDLIIGQTDSPSPVAIVGPEPRGQQPSSIKKK